MSKTRKGEALAADSKINSAIRKKTLENLSLYKNSNSQLIAKRLKQLDCEWDTGRVLETSAGILILLSSYYGLKSKRYWFLVTGLIGIFILFHSLKGWCPPLPLIRKCMIRTSEEIYNEKTALKVMRGDFNEITDDVSEILNRVEH